MAFNLDSAWKVAQTIFGIADVSRRVLNPSEATRQQRPAPTSRAAGGGLLGHVEARLTGVVISALKEAFDRDAARLDAERAALDDQRRRAEEALRLELVRQAADRALTRLRAIGVLALTIWIVSVLVAVMWPGGFQRAWEAAAAPCSPAGGLACSAGMGAAFAAHDRFRAGSAPPRPAVQPPPISRRAACRSPAPWLVLAGLALVAGSLLIAL